MMINSDNCHSLLPAAGLRTGGSSPLLTWCDQTHNNVLSDKVTLFINCKCASRREEWQLLVPSPEAQSANWDTGAIIIKGWLEESMLANLSLMTFASASHNDKSTYHGVNVRLA